MLRHALHQGTWRAAAALGVLCLLCCTLTDCSALLAQVDARLHLCRGGVVVLGKRAFEQRP
ncbi:hypothetical protein FA09DRAFT_327053 [Tilletiopsis washingtonensis]|uniref:Uncharacterized protein n=1 Tax=Tilletiopsis washingtonensis TaxID=58919 RepID=A0A316ZJ05_9BASI|nr:hypothetical protein FA09DRAFT_327053 [Tilletiopsis washingtonensis]PWO01089.1 hypothetical protein FA09DRAFT_327053 [Tilletiopsis washingtonensis]